MFRVERNAEDSPNIGEIMNHEKGIPGVLCKCKTFPQLALSFEGGVS